MAQYDSFAPDYDAWAADMIDDVQWYVSLAREANGPIVELAVGTARVAAAIAHETGQRVIGIDESPAMLALARRRTEGLPVELHEGDMRDLAVDEPVPLVICPGRSLMHLPTWADKRRVFERVAAALQPGGRFAFNVFAMSPMFAAALHDKRVEKPDGRWEHNRYVPADSRLELSRGRGDDLLGVLHIWWSSKSEWEGLIDVAGLEVEALYGGCNREPFDDDALEMVWVAKKA